MKQLIAGFCLSILLSSPAHADAKADRYRGITVGSLDAQGTNVDWGHAVGVVDHNVEHIFSVVTDYANYHRFLPNFQASRVLTARGTRAMVYMEVGVMKGTVTLWGQLKMNELPANGETRIVEAKLVQGNMDRFSARWELTPVADGKKTRVDFRILVDPSMPLPASVFSKENRKAAKKTLAALRERARLTLRS